MVPPVTIPNTVVKRCRADGSACIACARVGRRQVNFIKPVPETFRDGLFIFKLPGQQLDAGNGVSIIELPCDEEVAHRQV